MKLEQHRKEKITIHNCNSNACRANGTCKAEVCSWAIGALKALRAPFLASLSRKKHKLHIVISSMYNEHSSG